MNLQNILEQFTGSSNAADSAQQTARKVSGKLNQFTDNLPGGLIGGAAAGGIMALIAGNKSARKFAGKAAGYGGAALLGGLAWKALHNWQQSNRDADAADYSRLADDDVNDADYQLTLIKAMIAAAKADGHIDETEQTRIFKAIEQMNISSDMKALVFDLLGRPITFEEITTGVSTLEQKSQLYLVSCMVIDTDHPAEEAHLVELGRALQLPTGLPEQLQHEATQSLTDS